MSSKQSLKYSVPLGSVLSPLFHTIYTTPLGNIFSSHPLATHLIYADDTQIYLCLSQSYPACALGQLSTCPNSVRSWVDSNLLKLNPDQTTFLLFGTRVQRNSLPNFFPTLLLGVGHTIRYTSLEKIIRQGITCRMIFSSWGERQR